MRAKINITKWEQVPVPAMIQVGNDWSKQINECWKYVDKKIQTLCQIRNFSTHQFAEMKHIIIKLIDTAKLKSIGALAFLDSEEPSYHQKLWILSNVSKWSSLAVEVFPATTNMIDGANLYHIWQFKDSQNFPFDTTVINNTTEEIFAENFAEKIRMFNKDILYSLIPQKSSYGTVGYLFLKSSDGKELKWKEKQYLKNEIIGEDLTAVEVISEQFKKLGYTCLICLPIGYELDFGIHMS